MMMHPTKPGSAPDHEADDRAVHARAWRLAEGCLEDTEHRLALLYAAAMLKAALAVERPDPFAALEAMLEEHGRVARDLTAAAALLRGCH